MCVDVPLEQGFRSPVPKVLTCVNFKAGILFFHVGCSGMHMVLPEVRKQGLAGMLAPAPGGQWVAQDPGDASP